MSTLIIADIHLQPSQPEHPINLAFKRFLLEVAIDAEQLIILGDLFEVWLGDDISLPLFSEEISALKQLTEKGVQVLVQYGNRDFLMRKAFCEASGSKLLPEEYHARFGHQHIIMVHGDQLCTDDISYQKMRRWLRNPLVQWLFLHLPKSRRKKIGRRMRNQSKQAGSNKNEQLMDVTPKAIAKLFNRHPDANVLIHGHTHKPQYQKRLINNKTIQHYVLSDWRPQSSYLFITENDITIHDYQ